MARHFLTSYELQLKYNGEGRAKEDIAEILAAFFKEQVRQRTLDGQFLRFETLRTATCDLFEGYVKAGHYGMIGDIDDVDTGETVGVLNRNNAALYEHYYRCLCYSATKAIMILQRIGADGKKTAFSAIINEFIRTKYSEYKITFVELAQKDQVEKFFKQAKISKIVMEIHNRPSELDAGLDSEEKKAPFTAHLSISRPRVGIFNQLWKPQGVIKLYGEEWKRIRIHSKLGGRQATFEAENIFKTGIDLVLEGRMDEKTGLPPFDYISKQAQTLIKELLRAKGVRET